MVRPSGSRSLSARVGLEVLPQKRVGVIGHRDHIIPAVIAREQVKLVNNAEFRQLIVEELIALLKSVTILLAAIEIDFDSGFFDRRSVLLGDKNRVHRAEEFFIRRIAKDLPDYLKHELRAAIGARRMRQLSE